jgi:hypothetical protein
VLKTQHESIQFVLNKLTWELPLGTVRGQLDEPGPRFIDHYEAEERKAIQEEGKPSTTIGKVRAAG